VSRWKDADKVMALVVGGGYAEYCIAHESHALAVPAGLSLTEAGAIPETYFTVWYNTFERGHLAARETLLIHGGSSGIGTAAIQLAKAFGARVMTTAGSAEKCAACLQARRRRRHQLQDRGFRRGDQKGHRRSRR
jgi:NADPH2:quinone reductase